MLRIGSGWAVGRIGQVPHAANAGKEGYEHLLTSAAAPAWYGRTSWRINWNELRRRLWRIRSRCLDDHFGGDDTALFLNRQSGSCERSYGNPVPVASRCGLWRGKTPIFVSRSAVIAATTICKWDAVEWSHGH